MAIGMDRCIAEIQAAGGEEMSKAEARRALDFMEAAAARLERERGLDPAAAISQAAQDFRAAEAAAAVIERRNSLLNLQKRMSRRERMADVAGDIKHKTGPDLVQAIRAQITAINRVVAGGRASAERMWKTREAGYIGGVERDLRKAGLLSTFERGTLRDDWARELYEMSMRDSGRPHNVGITGSKEAQTIAEILRKYQALAKDRLNRQGAWVGDYAGYITGTSHDMDLVRRAGFDGWRAAIEPGLDERTFDGVEDRTRFLRSAWEGLATGVHLSDAGGVGMKDAAFAGPANLARKASAERVLHFRDADAWLAYQKQFGAGNLEEQFLGSLNRAARQEALLTRWGTNPRAEFDNDIRWMQEKYRATNQDAVVRLGDQAKNLRVLFDYLDGTANIPANQLGAQISAGVRAISSMAHLGGVALTHLSTLASKASELRYQGVGFLERYGNTITSLFHGLQSEERQQLADLMLAGVENSHGGMLAQIASGDTLPGQMSRTTNKYFTMTGLNYLLRGQKNGGAAVIARLLGSMADRDYAALPAETLRAFKQYNITAADWDALRQAPDHHTIDGRTFLTPDAAERSTATLTPAQRDALALKLHAYLTDVADRSVVTPGIPERALLLRGNNPGTVVGEALRFVTQFKTWGAAAVRQQLGREIYGGQGTAGAISGVIQIAISAMVAGYTTMVLKDLAKGLTPRSPTDPRTYMAALMQGGGFGLLGDFAFGEYNRFGHGVAETLTGPVIGGTLGDLGHIYSNILEGNVKDVPPELLRFGMSNTPFVNLFYARAAISYLFLHSLQERMSPGYLRRAERRLRERTGQTHWLSPQSNHLQTFGR